MNAEPPAVQYMGSEWVIEVTSGNMNPNMDRDQKLRVFMWILLSDYNRATMAAKD